MKKMRKMDRVTKVVLVVALILLTIMLISLGRDVLRSYKIYHHTAPSSSVVSSQTSQTK
jgi:hypothetical protein